MPLLVLQKGHCYRTSGATGTTGEQAFATAVADAAMRHIHGRNRWEVRPILADEGRLRYRGDAFVAIHCDGSIHPTARGASIGYRTPEGQAFGQAWKRAYEQLGWPGFRADNYTTALRGYYGVRTATEQGNKAAFILEAGFLTSPEDRALLLDGGADRVALALAHTMGIRQPALNLPTPVEDSTMKLMRGNNRDIIPNSGDSARPEGYAYGDLVFLVWADPENQDILYRRYIPWGSEYRLLVLMFGQPLVVAQADLDSIAWPNAAEEAPSFLRP